VDRQVRLAERPALVGGPLVQEDVLRDLDEVPGSDLFVLC
jgi:hypothetical protein